MAYSTIEDINPQLAQQKTRELRARVLSGSSAMQHYALGKRGAGSGEAILVLGGTGYIGKALIPELVSRGYRPVVMTRCHDLQAAEAFVGAEVHVGDVTSPADIEAAFTRWPIRGAISLLSSRHPADREECYKIDYQAVAAAISVAAGHDLEHFIHISDYGCYRPELLPQVYKLQIEGELIGRHFGEIDFTIVRPTAYFPYIAMNYSDIKHGEAYRLFDHGEYNLFNPIDRCDLAEFIVNQMFDPGQYGRILPVGGPWHEDNVHTIRSAGELMFRVQGVEEKFDVVPLKKWDRRIRMLRRMSRLYGKLGLVAGYLEAAKYWNVVSHVAPPYGTSTFAAYVNKLQSAGYDAGTFRERMKAGSSLTPDI